jgi:glycosyltransferase involved in cell wall biosynthesis
VVQTHSYKPTSIIFWLSHRRRRSYAWIGFHEGATDKGLKDWLYTRLDFRMLRVADRVVVMSQKQRDIFPKQLTHVHVVHNAVPQLPRAKDGSVLPPVLRRRRGEGSVPLIGAIGRLSREKGVDVFLDALAILKRRGVAAKGVVIGEGALEESLKAQAVALGLGDSVVLTGRIEAMREAYDALDLMVIPSRSEGLPSTLLEAMPTGLPVVSTAVGAMVEIAAEEPLSMRIVPPEQPGLLADAIAEALSNLADPAAAAARQRVVASYSIERRCDTMLAIYHDALTGRGRS